MTIPVTGAPTIGKVRPTMLARTAMATASQSPGSCETRSAHRPLGERRVPAPTWCSSMADGGSWTSWWLFTGLTLVLVTVHR